MEGYGAIRMAVDSALAETGFRLWTRKTFPGSWSLRGPAGALVAVLQEIGADLEGISLDFEFSR
jgi:hypothetical protein